MQVEQIDIADIVIGKRARSVDPERVASLKASIAALGLRTPITVRVVPEMVVDGVTTSEVPVLVTGLHRLQAFKDLGRTQIPAFVETGSDLDARMWEIAENLHRADLTVSERAHHVAEWVRLAEERSQIQPAQVAPPENPIGYKSPPRQRESGINAASRELGLDRTEAQRAIKIDGLAPETKAEAKILRLDDNQSALLKAARQPSKEEQLRSLREHAAQRQQPRPQSPARDPLNDFETVERQVDALMAAWNRAGPEAREIFLGRVDAPVADNSAALRAGAA